MAKIDINTELTKTNSALYCVFCKQNKKTSDFYVSHSNHAMLRIGTDNKPHSILCKECTQLLYEYFFRLFRSKQKALYQVCAALDLYYSDELFEVVQDSDMALFMDRYMTAYFAHYKDAPKTFVDSVQTKEVETKVEKSKKNTEDNEFTEEDLKNRSEVVSIFHYDPFEDEPPSSRKKLTSQLCAMCDDSLREDLVRQRAALEIVRSFARIDEWTKTIDTITKDPKKMATQAKDLKTLIETKAKETEMITKFSKDHGFAERYALAKSRGSGTLGAIIRDMGEYNYDDGQVNAYDICTSESMQQASDISFASVMRQIGLGEADYMEMVKTQREEITKLQGQLTRANEELRLIHKQVVKQELLKELADELYHKGLQDEDVTRLILSEIHYDDEIVKKMKKA